MTLPVVPEKPEDAMLFEELEKREVHITNLMDEITFLKENHKVDMEELKL